MKDCKETTAQLSLGRRIAWGSGGMAENFMANGLPSLALPIYSIGLGISPVVLGWAMLVPRVIDTVLDPLIGHWSDNTRSKFGRRRPWIFAGAILSAIFFALVWMAPLSWSKNAIVGWFLVTSIGYFIAYGIYTVTYNAMGYDLTEDYHERTRVQAWRFFFVMASAFVISWLYKLCFLPIFAGTEISGIRKEVIGVRWVGVLAGLLILFSGLMPVLFCRERTSSHNQPHVPLLKAMRLTMTNRPFQKFIGMILLSTLGFGLVGPFGIYINIYYVYDGNKEMAAMLTGMMGLIGSVAGVASTPVVTWVSIYLGKRGTILLGQALLALSFVSSWVFFSPQYPYLMAIPVILVGSGMCCLQVLYGSLLADICDMDELSSGSRREGMYGASAMFINKIIASATTVISGYLLVFSGYSAELAKQTVSTVTSMRILYAVVPTILLAIGAALALALPMTSKHAAEVREQLVLRREEKAKTPEEKVDEAIE